MTTVLGVPGKHDGSSWSHSLLQSRALQGKVHGLPCGTQGRRRSWSELIGGRCLPHLQEFPLGFQCLSLRGESQTWETPISPFKTFIHWACFFQRCFYRHWLCSNVKFGHKSSFLFDFYCYFHKSFNSTLENTNINSKMCVGPLELDGNVGSVLAFWFWWLHGTYENTVLKVRNSTLNEVMTYYW